MEIIMSLKFLFKYEVVRLVVCQSFYKKKKNLKIIPRKCKRPFFEKKKLWLFEL